MIPTKDRRLPCMYHTMRAPRSTSTSWKSCVWYGTTIWYHTIPYHRTPVASHLLRRLAEVNSEQTTGTTHSAGQASQLTRRVPILSTDNGFDQGRSLRRTNLAQFGQAPLLQSQRHGFYLEGVGPGHDVIHFMDGGGPVESLVSLRHGVGPELVSFVIAIVVNGELFSIDNQASVDFLLVFELGNVVVGVPNGLLGHEDGHSVGLLLLLLLLLLLCLWIVVGTAGAISIGGNQPRTRVGFVVFFTKGDNLSTRGTKESCLIDVWREHGNVRGAVG